MTTVVLGVCHKAAGHRVAVAMVCAMCGFAAEAALTTGDYPFGYCSSLTNLVVGEGFNNFSDRFLRNCDALRTLHLKRLPATMHSAAFQEVDAKGFRMLVPRTAEWAEFAAKYVTPWKGDPCVSAADKAAYFARFGAGTPKPVGLISAATTDDGRTLPKNQWFAYEPIGTMLFIK